MMEYSVSHGRFVDSAKFRVIDKESGIRSVPIRFALEVAMQGEDMLFQIFFKMQHVSLISFITPEYVPCRKEIFRANYLFK